MKTALFSPFSVFFSFPGPLRFSLGFWGTLIKNRHCVRARMPLYYI